MKRTQIAVMLRLPTHFFMAPLQQTSHYLHLFAGRCIATMTGLDLDVAKQLTDKINKPSRSDDQADDTKIEDSEKVEKKNSGSRRTAKGTPPVWRSSPCASVRIDITIRCNRGSK